jgi:hypothetical protein
MGVAIAVGQAAGIVVAGVFGDSVGVVTLLNIQGALYLLAAAMAARWLRPGRRQRNAARAPGLTAT